MKKIMALAVNKVGDDVLLPHNPQVNERTIVRVLKADSVKKGDIVLRFDDDVTNKALFVLYVLGPSQTIKSNWDWKYINFDGTLSEINGSSQPHEFYTLPIPYDINVNIGKDDSGGNIMTYMDVYDDNPILNRSSINDRDINYILEDMAKYNPKINKDSYKGKLVKEVAAEFREFYRTRLPVDLITWSRVNAPDNNMVYRQGYWDQVIFIRDTVMGILCNNYDDCKQNLVHVISTHRSKSIELPVYGIDIFNKYLNKEIQLIIRYNFYDWKISVNSETELNYDFMNIFNTKEKIPAVYCQGFNDEWVFGSFHDNKKQFTIEISGTSDVYMFMKILKYYINQ